MKQTICLLIPVLLFTQLVLSQRTSREPGTAVKKINCKVLSFEAVENKFTEQLPFSRIVLEDLRQDTTKLGFARELLSGKQLIYCGGGSFANISAHINKYYQKNLDSQSPYELLICVRKLWLSHFDTTNGKVDIPKEFRSFTEFLYFKADVYLRHRETYYPVLRVDSIIVGGRKQMAMSSINVQNAFFHTIDSASKINAGILTKRKPRSRDEINAYNKLPSLPIFEVPVPEKGIYCSFTEFKFNQPCYKEFLIRFESRTDIIYVKGADGNLFVKRDVWGLSDGKNVFIRMGDNLFPLHRLDHTWEFFGTFKFVKSNFEIPIFFAGGVGGLALAAATSTMQGTDEARFKAKDMRPYQVDMETGKFY